MMGDNVSGVLSAHEGSCQEAHSKSPSNKAAGSSLHSSSTGAEARELSIHLDDELLKLLQLLDHPAFPNKSKPSSKPGSSPDSPSLSKDKPKFGFLFKLFGGRSKKAESNDVAKKIKRKSQEYVSALTAALEDPQLPKEDVEDIVCRLERLFFRYQLDLNHMSLLLDFYPNALERMWLDAGKATSSHWKYLPEVMIVTKDFSHVFDGVDGLRAICRHPVDDRFDHKEVMVSGQKAIFGSKAHPLTNFCKIKCRSSNLLSCQLTATYPWVPVKEDDQDNLDFSSNNPNVRDGKVLINDPNNDGFVVSVYPGLAVGAVVDGSGCGFKARLAANIVLAVVHEMTDNLVNMMKTASPGALSSKELFKWLQKVIVNSHKRIKSTTEAGSTTAAFFVINKMSSGATVDYVCFYAATGDVEGYYFSKQLKKWKYLFRGPARFDSLRIDPSHTPGGLGGTHGDHQKLHGMYLWQKSDWFYENPPSEERRSSRTNNLHFGMVSLSSEDYLLLSTDGLGDAIDPVRIFLEPSFARKFATSYGFNYINSSIAKTMPTVLGNWALLASKLPFSAQDTHHLKEKIFNLVIQKDILNEEDSVQEMSPELIVKRCIDFAMYVTQGVRTITGDVNNQAADKTDLFEGAINKWLFELKQLEKKQQLKATSYISPFAKPDHLGIVCIKVSSIE